MSAPPTRMAALKAMQHIDAININAINVNAGININGKLERLETKIDLSSMKNALADIVKKTGTYSHGGILYVRPRDAIQAVLGISAIAAQKRFRLFAKNHHDWVYNTVYKLERAYTVKQGDLMKILCHFCPEIKQLADKEKFDYNIPESINKEDSLGVDDDDDNHAGNVNDLVVELKDLATLRASILANSRLGGDDSVRVIHTIAYLFGVNYGASVYCWDNFCTEHDQWASKRTHTFENMICLKLDDMVCVLCHISPKIRALADKEHFNYKLADMKSNTPEKKEKDAKSKDKTEDKAEKGKNKRPAESEPDGPAAKKPCTKVSEVVNTFHISKIWSTTTAETLARHRDICVACIKQLNQLESTEAKNAITEIASDYMTFSINAMNEIKAVSLETVRMHCLLIQNFHSSCADQGLFARIVTAWISMTMRYVTALKTSSDLSAAMPELVDSAGKLTNLSTDPTVKTEYAKLAETCQTQALKFIS